jgi:preprotein translocase subunit SecF
MSLLALLLFGGQAIHSFTATMMFGVVLVGTYTSVFIASPILIYLGVGTSRAQVRDDDETPAIEPAPPVQPAAKPSANKPAARARR